MLFHKYVRLKYYELVSTPLEASSHMYIN